MPIETLNKERCTGCGICVALCQEDVLRIDNTTGKALIKYADDCVACFVCESYCPSHCINVSKDRARPIPPPY